MSLDSRNSSAFMKRAEQLKRWEESDTNKEPPVPKNRGTKIKFSSGCIFLAACVAGDKDEVKQLIENGADIDTTNIDGLTALHQACIDDNLDMVEFLISQGADVNKKDNEGWTPLHVTASCDILSIARYLIENGSDLAAINSDGDLPIDLVGSNEMRELIQKHIDEQGIDCDEAKRIEEKIMLEDAKRWLRSDASEADRPHPKTGATSLHVAAAKGYTKVLSLLLAGRADVDKQDNDGWTPLHAAAHWGQKEACQMLVASLADMDILNYAGQSALEVAQDDIVSLLEELKKNNKRTKRRPASQNRISDNNLINNAEYTAETPSKVIRIDVKTENEKKLEEKPKAVEPAPPAAPAVTTIDNNKSTLTKDKELIQEEEQSWRRPNSIRTREKQESPPKVIPTSDKQVPDKENQPQTTNQNQNSADSGVILRRTHSFESDDAFYIRLKELRARIKANSCSNLPVPAQQVTGNGAGNNNSTSQLNNFIVQRSASLKDHKQIRKPPTSPPSSPGTTQTSTAPSSGVRRSFVPPTRDEESETQRKAHAKRVRETRRSTQGVTLEEIKSAEQLVKKKNSENESVTTVTLHSAGHSAPERVPATPTLAGGEFRELLRRQKEASPPEQVSASYTIVTPSSIVRSRAVSESTVVSSGSDNATAAAKVSASYTIAPPTASSPTTTTVPVVTKDDVATASSSVTKVAVTATYSVPLTTSAVVTHNNNTNNNNNHINLKKTEEVAKSGSPTVKNRFRWDDTTTTSMAGHESTTSDDSHMKAPPVPAQRFPPEFTVHRYVRDKRQIFDLEMSANPLTLAEKLRIEASKYADTSRSSNDLPLTRSDSESSDVPNNSSGTTTSTSNALAKKYDSVPSSPAHHATAERRPSWRLRLDTGSKFKLEDAPNKVTATTNPVTAQVAAPTTSTTTITAPTSVPVIPIAAQRRVLNTNSNAGSFTVPLTSSAPSTTASAATSNNRPLVTAPTITSVYAARAGLHDDSQAPHRGDRQQQHNDIIATSTQSAATEVTLPLRQRGVSTATKEPEVSDDKENDSKSGQATQGLIQRRRRPKRRSTGVVHLDADDLDPDRQDADDKESGGESRLDSEKGDASENGEFIDYKALYFAEKAANDQLKQQLTKKDEELASLKAALERFTNATTKNTLSEIEKRERRAMERKISELEEELKQMETLKVDNQRLKDENGALIRVISKLSK